MKQNIFLTLILIFYIAGLHAQQAWEVVYHRSANGEIDTTYTKILTYKDGIACLSSGGDKTLEFIDY